jgi:valyl-tRNA synthetase
MIDKNIEQMDSKYNPSAVEQRIYNTWLKNGYFSPDINSDKEPFTITMPPPNVTGELHLGHALEKAIEDALIRWKRMKGFAVLWQPGSDHAGIATQWAVELQLAKEGISRHDLGRDKFLENVWDHVTKYGGIIHEQSRRLGISADWTRHLFTLDEGPSLAVRTTFVNLYKKGLIYRNERIINWCPRCSTALSDLEVNYKDVQGKLYYVKYFHSNSSDYVTVATTRPETLFGDTAVGMNPSDERFIDGITLIVPLCDREVPLIADDGIELGFGTGVLKVTPAHDVLDFDIGQRHDLPSLCVINNDGTLNELCGKYDGVDRFDARNTISQELEDLGYLEKIEEYQHSVGSCQRCDSVLEPLPSLQWFVNVGSHEQENSIAGKAYKAVTSGDISIIPERFTKIYLNWISNIRDWCISRQLWWGHRIPVWYCEDCEELTVAIDDPNKCEHCSSPSIFQDEDVLDTWFSSGLWPHSTLGWPNETKAYEKFYPTSVLETGYDILFFWVARMIMMGIENTGTVPFKTVLLHGLIRDSSGAKMSKTRGNTLNPLELIDKYGTDALRFALTTGTAPGNDLRISEGKLEASRNFTTKIWNAARYVIGILDKNSFAYNGELFDSDYKIDVSNREDFWILSKLERLITATNQSLEQFEIGEAQQKIYEFIWNDYCDWYIEMSKVRIAKGDEDPLKCLLYVLVTILKLIHPFMPYITEEIWQAINQRSEKDLNSIMVANYPESTNVAIPDNIEDEISTVIQVIKSVRNIRSEFNINPKQKIDAFITSNAFNDIFNDELDLIKSTATINEIYFTNHTNNENSVNLVINGVNSLQGDPVLMSLPLSEIVDLDQEINRLTNDLESCINNIKRLDALVSNEKFREKADPVVVNNEIDKLKASEIQRDRLQEIMSNLKRD